MRIAHNNRAAELLDRCAALDPALIDGIAHGMGVERKVLEACRAREARLDPPLQVALARVVMQLAPVLAQHARRLTEQAQAALLGAEHVDTGFGNRAAPSVLRHRHSSE